jgi:hypothetical protein
MRAIRDLDQLRVQDRHSPRQLVALANKLRDLGDNGRAAASAAARLGAMNGRLRCDGPTFVLAGCLAKYLGAHAWQLLLWLQARIVPAPSAIIPSIPE